MKYDIIKVDKKPKTAPNKFCVYLYKEKEYVFCPIRNKCLLAKPEEKVRQWWIYRLREVYGYSFKQLAVEVQVLVGSTYAKKRADIVVYNDDKLNNPRIFVEVKKPKRKDGVDQLKVYMNATGCRLGLWSNGEPPYVYLLRMEPKAHEENATWRELRNIPTKTETLADVDNPLIRDDLDPATDFLSVVKDCEDHIKAHEGVNAFEEIFKLIIAKLYDEKTNLKKSDSKPEFRVGIFEPPADAAIRITNLFANAQKKWKGIFEDGEQIYLSPDSIAFCVSAFQKMYLLKSSADVLGAAFEVMVNPDMKGNKGQYFTPRHVVKMCVDIIKPQRNETIFDPACGSGGFLVGALDYVYKKIESERDNDNDIIEDKKDYASECVFGMDYDSNIAKVAKAYMLIWGDGRSNIAACDALNENQWNKDVRSKFIEEVTEDDKPIEKPRQFDIIVTNPPFAGDISTEETLSLYELAYKEQKNGARVRVNSIGKEKLFIERCIKMLKPNGRMAIVLPRGIMKNYSDERIREYILKHAEILAVVNLGGDMFKPFTNTKTVVVFIQKHSKDITNIKAGDMRETQYCSTELSGKDKSGNIVEDNNGNILSDLPDITDYINENIVFYENR